MNRNLCLLCLAAALLLLGLPPGRADVPAAPGVRIAMNDPAILYSPFNWVVTAGSAGTVNSGAYFKILFSGTSCRLATDTSHNAAPFSQFSTRVDGGPWTVFTLAAGDPVFPAATGLPTHWHLLEVIVKSTSERLERWTMPQTIVAFTGIVLDDGAKVAAPARKPFNILIYGDSITEGVLTQGTTAALETDRNDARPTWSWQLSQMLPAEVGVVGFGFSGLTHPGSGSVPPLSKSFDLIYAGHPRAFAEPAPDLVLYNEGTNDWVDITGLMTAVVKGVQARAPHARQVVMEPFGGFHAAQLQQVVKRIRSPNVVYLSTTGFMDARADTVDGIHPWASTDIGLLAPRIAAALYSLLQSSPPVPSGKK